MFQVIDSCFQIRRYSGNDICMLLMRAAMTGSVKGLFGQVKKINPDIKWMHRIIHREVGLLTSKRMSPDLNALRMTL